MRGRLRERARPLAVGAVAAGGALATATGGRTWARGEQAGAPGLPALPVDLTGGDLAGPVGALGLAALAAAAALLAVRGRAARLVGALALALGAGVAATAWAGARADADGAAQVVERTAWPWLAVAGGVLVAAGGLLALVHGGRWSGLSRRYDAPAPPAGSLSAGSLSAGTLSAGTPPERLAPAPPASSAHPARDAWDALDRGEDPTTGPR